MIIEFAENLDGLELKKTVEVDYSDFEDIDFAELDQSLLSATENQFPEFDGGFMDYLQNDNYLYSDEDNDYQNKLIEKLQKK